MSSRDTRDVHRLLARSARVPERKTPAVVQAQRVCDAEFRAEVMRKLVDTKLRRVHNGRKLTPFVQFTLCLWSFVGGFLLGEVLTHYRHFLFLELFF